MHARDAALTRSASVRRALFGGNNAVTTAALWLSFFGTLLILYLLVNWLPLLLIAAGYKRADAALLSIIFNVGGGVGAIILGSLMDRGARGRLIVAAYIGMAAALMAFSMTLRGGAVAWSVVAAVAFAVGFFVIGGQLVLYGIAPNYYVTATRSTGVGAAVAAGRVGAVVGPLIAGQMLGAGNDAGAVVRILLPIVAAAGAGALLLIFRPTPAE
jgi:AAHS family 3-hydroxyphenylpropionic acid transporter